MAATRIAMKNIVAFFKNPFFTAFLVAIPVFQLFIINNMVTNSQAGASTEGFVKVVTIEHALNNIVIQQFASALVVQFIFLTAVFAATTFVGEKEKNTLLRIYTTPVSKFSILSGVLLGNCVISFVITTVTMLLCRLLFGIHWGNSISLVIIVLLSSFISGAFALLISGIFKNSKIIAGVMSVIIIMMTMLSGGLIPLDQLGIVPYLTINKWIADAFQFVMQGCSFDKIYINVLIMIILGSAFLTGAVLLYRRENSYE